MNDISIHALLAESDDSLTDDVSTGGNFYPRSPCGERRLELFLYYQDNTISIHALLAESDNSSVNTADKEARFLSTLSLRRATLPAVPFRILRMLFLSTLSLRRATVAQGADFEHKMNFYPRSPCGERLRVVDGSKSSIEISIHALLAESDHINKARGKQIN